MTESLNARSVGDFVRLSYRDFRFRVIRIAVAEPKHRDGTSGNRCRNRLRDRDAGTDARAETVTAAEEDGKSATTQAASTAEASGRPAAGSRARAGTSAGARTAAQAGGSEAETHAAGA